MDEPRAHSEDAFSAMVKILGRASGGRAIDIEALQEDVRSLIYAIGLMHDGSEEDRIWLEFAAEEPSHAALAGSFARAAEAENPLARDVLTLDLRPGLGGRIRNR